MSTTLTKPVLLDETGQSIVDKLDEIRSAIGGTGEFTPVMIKVTTPPIRTTYGAGDRLDLTGIVVELFGSNGTRFNITDGCTFSPANGDVLTSADTTIDISYVWYKDGTVFNTFQNIKIKTFTSIEVTTPPILTEYYVGETLDLTGIVVTAYFDDNTSQIVTSQCVFTPADGATLTIHDDPVNISCTIGAETKTTTQDLTINAHIYGVEWDGTSSPILSRTDLAADFSDPNPYYSGMNTTPSSPFDNIMPWAGIVKVTDNNAGSLVKIPKFYYKWTENGDALKLQIAPEQFPGSHVSPAHMDRGDGQGERDYVYVGAYSCATSTYKSTSDVLPITNITRIAARTAISNLGSDIWQWDFATWWTILMLYLVEFAHWNAKLKIGLGVSGSLTKTGQTDSMPYHTGTMATSKNSNGHSRYRYIEDLWTNCYNYCDGFYFDSGRNAFCIINPSEFSENTGGVPLGRVDLGSWAYISKWRIPSAEGYEFALVPDETNGTTSTYICSECHSSTNGSPLLVGGSYSDQKFNIFSFYEGYSGDSNIGTRLMKLPSNT